jgi:fructokinase
VENDANCFALSEAADGAGEGQSVVFGVIIGTGCGGGIVFNGQVLRGRHRIAGEWGHTPLPWPNADEMPGTHCWCGHRNCLETLISGTGLAMDCDGPEARDASGIPTRAAAGEARAIAALERHADRLARGLAVIINLIDPDVIVLGGGLSNMAHLYTEVPRRMVPHVFSDFVNTPVVRNKHGDSSGVRGAAWLWPAPLT